MADVEQREMSLFECSEQLEASVERVKKFDYSQFSDVTLIGSGKFTIIFSATFEDKKYALKSLNNNLKIDVKPIRLIKREIEILYDIEHENIIKFYGISKDSLSRSFMLVFQLADGGTLREHLEKKLHENIYKISWCELIQIANGIANGNEFSISENEEHARNIVELM
ncbi:21472_t:CDS:2, partial [Cetraspora pellucida]